MLQVYSTEGCLPISNVCLFNDGKGALKNIMRRLPELLPELPEICVCCSGGGVRSLTVTGASSCSFKASFWRWNLLRSYSSKKILSKHQIAPPRTTSSSYFPKVSCPNCHFLSVNISAVAISCYVLYILAFSSILFSMVWFLVFSLSLSFRYLGGVGQNHLCITLLFCKSIYLRKLM